MDGNRVFRFPGNKIVKSADGGLYSQLASLPTLRGFLAIATVNGYRVMTVDVTSAYLQAEWPANVESHYITLPEKTRIHLPEQLRAAAEQMKRPAFRLAMALYGHPASGHIWATKGLAGWLTKTGWKPTEIDPALWHRNGALLLTYVDDLSLAATEQSAEEFWEEFTTEFACDDLPAPASEFIGVGIKFDWNDQRRITALHMPKYVDYAITKCEET